jgi:3-oxoadipate enol-lactonase
MCLNAGAEPATTAVEQRSKMRPLVAMEISSMRNLTEIKVAELIPPPFQMDHSPRELRLSDHVTQVIDTGGEGVPVVLIHSLATDHRMWAEVIHGLAPRHRMIAYDIRGHGAAARAPKPFSVPLFASDLRDLLDRLNIKQAHLYGISAGGAVAQQFAVSHAERVASLALIATFSKPQAIFAQRGQSGVMDGMPAQLVPTLTRWFTPAALAINGPGVQYARACVLNMQPDDWQASWTALSTIDFFVGLASIKVPVKVITGELDLSCTPELMKRDIVEQLPTATLQVIPDAAHMVSLEKTSELVRLLLAETW